MPTIPGFGRVGPRGPGGHGPVRGDPTQFRPSPAQYGSRNVSGITRDVTGAVLGSCTVDLFVAGTNAWVATVTSDPTTGAYSFPVQTNDGTAYFVRCYKVGAPNVFGTSDNSLVGV